MVVSIEKQGSAVYLYGRDENKNAFEKVINNFRPYFYVDDVAGESFSIFGNRVRKVYVRDPGHVTLRRTEYTQSYESKVMYVNRFLVDSFETIESSFIRKCYLDIETEMKYELNVKKAKNKIMSITTFDNKKKKYFVFCLRPSDQKAEDKKGKKISYYFYDDERDLLLSFVRYIQKTNPDMLLAWNGSRFDFPYIIRRLEINGIHIGQLSRRGITYINDFGEAVVQGRILFDLLEGYKKITPSEREKYSLDFIAAFEGIGSKVKYEGTLDDLYNESVWKYLRYNRIDVKLMIDIDEKQSIVDYFDIIRRIARCKFEDVFSNMRVVENMILCHCKELGLVCPTYFDGQKSNVNEGALVLEALKQVFKNVSVADAKSLYPNIIRSFNMSPETLVRPEDVHKFKKEDLIEVGNGYYFRKDKRGIIPQILDKLFGLRDSYKKKMKHARKKYGSDSIKYKTFDRLQYAVKVIMNSFFGVLGNVHFMLYTNEVADSILFIDRQFIRFCADKAEELGVQVIYGDSVAADTTIRIKEDGKHTRISIASLFKCVTHHDEHDKEYDSVQRAEVLTLDKDGKSVYRPIRYVMRHKCEKQMYRLWFTNSWYIDVTEDHSLFGYMNAKHAKRLCGPDRIVEVKPTEVGKDIKSLISLRSIPYRAAGSESMYPIQLFELMGYFIGNGSFDRKYEDKQFYLHLATGDDTNSVIELVLKPLKKSGWIKKFWIKKKGDICINGLSLVRLFNDSLRDNHGKKIPELLFEESVENIAAFVRGYFSADGSVMIRNNRPIIRLTSIHQSFVEQTRELLFRCGVASSIFAENTENSYRGKGSGTFSKQLYIKDPFKFSNDIKFFVERKQSRIRDLEVSQTHKNIVDYDFLLQKVFKVEEIPYDDYVYDIEVDDLHRFFANDILVHNTDSIFLRFSDDTKIDKRFIDHAKGIIEKINSSLDDFAMQHNLDDHHFDLEFEKAYRSILFTGAKKRYAAIEVWKDGRFHHEPKLKVTGFESVRADWPQFFKDFQKDVLRAILEFKKKSEVDAMMEEFADQFYDRPPEDICRPSSVGETFETNHVTAHFKAAHLANKYMKAGIRSGDKIRWGYVKKVPDGMPYHDRIAFTEKLYPGYELDYDKHAEKLIRKKFKPLYECVGWDFDVRMPNDEYAVL